MLKTEDVSSRERLLDAVVAMWGVKGHAGVSARGIAQATGLPTSSIYHHFGNLERLFLDGQMHALSAAKRWCATQTDLIGAAPAGVPEAFPGLFAMLIDDWSREQRMLGLTWRECYLLAARDPLYIPVIEGWHALWLGFWEEICGRCGLPGMGEITSYAFDSESVLHMMQWRRPVDRACLDEFARGWGRWLTGSLAPEGPWRKYAREEALATRPLLREQEGVAAQIAAAAADVVEEHGVAKLTHRAVAERAGLTLGTVSYNYRTSSDLVRVTFETIYSRIVPASGFGNSAAHQATHQARGANLQTKSSLLLALEELVVAVARDPDLSAFGPQLRYLRGRSSGVVLQAAIGPARQVSPLDAALYSSFLSGQGRVITITGRDDLGTAIARTSDQVLGLLGVTG